MWGGADNRWVAWEARKKKKTPPRHFESPFWASFLRVVPVLPSPRPSSPRPENIALSLESSHLTAMDERPALLSASTPAFTPGGQLSPTGVPLANGVAAPSWTTPNNPGSSAGTVSSVSTVSQAQTGAVSSTPISSGAPVSASPPPSADSLFREYLYRNCRDSLFWLEVGTHLSFDGGHRDRDSS